MNREEILAAYCVQNGIIRSGKFTGQPVFAPAFWDDALCGSSDETLDDGDTLDDGVAYEIFEVTPDDRKLWPEIAADTAELWLHEDNDGFVHCSEMTAEDARHDREVIEDETPHEEEPHG